MVFYISVIVSVKLTAAFKKKKKFKDIKREYKALDRHLVSDI